MPVISRATAHAGRFDAVFVRRLCHPLDPVAIAAIQRCAEVSCSQLHDSVDCDELAPECPSMESARDEEVMVYMVNPKTDFLSRFMCAPRVERFLTSQPVASMLCCAGQATQEEGHTFMAITPDERIFHVVQELPSWLLTQPSRHGIRYGAINAAHSKLS